MLARSGDRTKKIWQAIFERSGGNGFDTRLFEDLHSSYRQMLSALGQFRETEVPVIGSYQNETEWLVLTTERIISKNHGDVSAIALHELVRVEMELRNPLSARDAKRGVGQVTLRKEGGERVVIPLEPGRPLAGVLSILHNVCRRNRRAREGGAV